MSSAWPNAETAARFKSDRAMAQARRRREKLTPSEKRLWQSLRRLVIEGSHVRRQAPFGPFIVDFVCHGARLVVEVDGGAHLAPEVALRDQARAEWLKQRGYDVLRVAAPDVMRDSDSVAALVAREVQWRLRLQHSEPSPSRGG